MLRSPSRVEDVADAGEIFLYCINVEMLDIQSRFCVFCMNTVSMLQAVSLDCSL